MTASTLNLSRGDVLFLLVMLAVLVPALAVWSRRTPDDELMRRRARRPPT